MFTGIIEDLGRVEAIGRKSGIFHIQVKSHIFTGQKIGDSIAVNGVCLTILDLKNDLASFDIMEETLKRANLNRLKIGDKVNLERALKVGDRLSGHFVTGHVDCVAKIIEKNEKIKIKIPNERMKFTVPKGSVALDGVSLTIANIGGDSFTVYLIPHTIKNTNLGNKKIGDELNVEFDILGKYALNVKDNEKKSKITEDFLKLKGFVKS